MKKRKVFLMAVLCAAFSFLLPFSQVFAAYVGPIKTSRNLIVDTFSDTSYPLSDSSSVYVQSGQWLRITAGSYGNQPVYVKVTSGGKVLYEGYIHHTSIDKYVGAPVGEAKIYLSCSWLDDLCYGEGMLGTYYKQ